MAPPDHQDPDLSKSTDVDSYADRLQTQDVLHGTLDEPAPGCLFRTSQLPVMLHVRGMTCNA